MRKYILRYFIFWLPAALMAYFFRYPAAISQILQWFFAFFMVFGWAVNTAMCAYHYPRSTLSLMLAYLGFSILIIIGLYNAPYSSPAHYWLSLLGGILNFKPLDIFVMALLDFNIQHELVVTYILVAFCAVGYLTGIVFRHIRPNPYRPKLYKSP